LGNCEKGCPVKRKMSWLNGRLAGRQPSGILPTCAKRAWSNLSVLPRQGATDWKQMDRMI